MRSVAREVELVRNDSKRLYRGALSRLMEATTTKPRYQLYALDFSNSAGQMEVNAVVSPTRNMPSVLRIQELFQ